jgi:hydroxypyruvate isomerase
VKHAISIKFMWAELPLPERARRAAAHGFDRVDLWDWRGEDIDGLAEVCAETGLEIACVFGHARGALCDPAQHDEVLASLAETVAVLDRYGFLQLSMFSDARGPDGRFVPGPPLTDAQRRRACVEGLRKCLELVEGTQATLTLEAINTVFVPTYFLTDFGASLEICREIDHPQLRVFFDAYHQQLVGGRLLDNLVDGLPWIASVHVADVPGRGAPGTGEINFHAIRRALEEHDYDGQLTFEVVPTRDPDTEIAACKEVFPF